MKTLLSLSLGILLIASHASALIMVQQGDAPVANLGWPEGAENVANLSGRIGYWEGPPFGGGQYVFEFPPADTATVQTAIDTLATVKSQNLQLNIVNATHTSTFLERGEDSKTKAAVGYTFTVWIGENWNRLYNNKESTFLADQPGYGQPVPGPLLTVYLSPDSGLDVDKLVVPDNVKVSDSRLSKAAIPDHLKQKGNAVVTGHITHAITGLPVPGVDVTLASSRETNSVPPSTTTHADGSFTLVWKGGHHVYIHATADGYARRRSSALLSLLADTLHDNHHLTLAPAASLTGVVTNDVGAPLAGITVRAHNTITPDGAGYPQPDNPQAITAGDGTFTLTGLPTGSTRLGVHASGCYYPDSLSAHRVGAHRVGASSPVTVALIGTGTITGIVEQHPDPRYKDRTWNVSIQEYGREGVGSWGGSTNCKQDRTFTFKNVPRGVYTLVPNTPKSKNSEPATPSTVIVKAGETTTVTLTP